MGGSETEVERSVRSIGALDFYDARLSFCGEFAPDLLESRIDFRQCLGRIVIQFQSNGNLARASNAFGFDVIDPSDRGDGFFDRCGQEPANRLGTCSDIDRRDDDRGAFKFGELLHGQRLGRSDSQQNDHEVDNDRKDRVPNKNIGNRFHR